MSARVRVRRLRSVCGWCRARWRTGTRRFWGLAIAGYALTVVSVPLLGVAGVL
ncbi:MULTISPECIES: hypothetical protein [unclassified Streptomyces]|uniref:hypothetical protein n=1 Tax=unclassified Streptomyces TaxID=2593676 RepID=UPI001BAE7074|nr:hypothetical protein [Streptomyces sp. V17-9]